jgi:hypothetical protein
MSFPVTFAASRVRVFLFFWRYLRIPRKLQPAREIYGLIMELLMFLPSNQRFRQHASFSLRKQENGSYESYDLQF